MSPHQNRYRNRIYNYYRCRSNTGGRPPCPNVCVSPGRIEHFVIDTLSDPETYSQVVELDDQGRRRLEGLASIRPSDKVRVFSQLLEEVIFDPDAGEVRLTLDIDGVVRSIQDQSGQQ